MLKQHVLEKFSQKQDWSSDYAQRFRQWFTTNQNFRFPETIYKEEV